MPENIGALAVFRHRMFRALWLASLVSNFGSLIQLVGAAWLMTFLSSSQSMVALVQASVTLPIMLTALAAGVLADNFNRRSVMLVAQVFMLIVSVILIVLAFLDLLSPWLLLALTFLIGCGTGLNQPSWQASVSELVPRNELPLAVSMNAMGMNITRSVGPAIGGVIVGWAGAAAAFAVNALSYLAIIAALLAWKPLVQPRRLPRERFDSALAAGLRYFFMSPNLITSTFRGFVFGFAAISMQALAPLVARDQLSGGALLYGVLLGAFGLGAVLGALLAARLRARLESEALCKMGFLVFATSCVIVGLSTNIFVTTIAVFLAGLCWLNILSLINVTVQLSTPRWVLGRMLALYMTGIFGGMAGGSWIWGVVCDTHGIPTAFLGSAAVLVFGALWGLRSPLPQPGNVNLDPLNRFNEPALRLDLRQRSGPITLMVEYEIAQPDVPEFLKVMSERRRIRLRDSAKNWALQRDLENPDVWMETFQFPTWIEYLRHHERRTHADYEATERLTTLHRGSKPFRVHRMIERSTVPLRDDMPRLDVNSESLP